MDMVAYKVHINAFKCLSAHILSHTVTYRTDTLSRALFTSSHTNALN